MAKIIYLHGFCSSPGSSKAQYFKHKFAERGLTLHIPDLNVPDFEHLTLTAMLAKIAETIRSVSGDDAPVYLVGSSMGGAVALHFTEQYRHAEASRVEKLVLLAPALDFMANRQKQLGADGLRQWRESGWLDVYHYGYKTEQRVHYGLLEDLQRYDSYAAVVNVPTLIYHGEHDESVDYRQSARFAESRSHVTLHVVASDHQLLDMTDEIWAGTVAFFGL